MQVVVISHNQAEFMDTMIEALKGHDVVYVLDRCTDQSEKHQVPANVRTITNHEGSGFLAGRMRDLGASKMDFTKPILFLDGDRVPSGNLDILESIPFDIICLGTANDARKWITSGEGLIPWINFTNPNNDVYSCGIYLRPPAIAAARDASPSGRIFHEIFDGNWGEEDRYLGDVAHQAGLTLGYTSRVTLAGKINGLTTSNSGAFAVNWITRLKLSGRLGREQQLKAGDRQDALTRQLMLMGESGWLLDPTAKQGQSVQPSHRNPHQG